MNLKLGKVDLHQATSYIQELVADPNVSLNTGNEDFDTILKLAKAGKTGYDKKVQEVVIFLMNKYGLLVNSMATEQAAVEIYKYLWGLDVIEELYRKSDVDEVRINEPNKVYYQENGCNKESDIKFKDDENIHKIIARTLEHDRALLDESNPGCESRRLDGARVTALGYPVTKGPVLVIRKHGTYDISDNNYIKSGSMDEYILFLLSLLVKGRANILLVGDTNTGKTTLLRKLVRYLHPKLRIVSLETDRELNLEECYPERDIIPVEAHPEVGWDIRRCYISILRLSPNVIIVGEARGLGEANIMINACRSGHHGSMGTLHVFDIYEAVSVLAQMAIEEGSKLPITMLENKIASSFNVVIELYGNSVSGIRRVNNIVELEKGIDGPKYIDLVKWRPSDENFDIGSWDYIKPISQRLTAKLFKFGVSKEELAQLERMRVNGE